jgi:hypothetical protein
MPTHESNCALVQGLRLVHFWAQLKRFLWDRRCIQGVFRGCLGGVRGYTVCVGYVLYQKPLRLS